MGYRVDDFGYRLWGPIERKIVRSRDVVFFDDQTIEDIQNSTKPRTSNQESPIIINPVPSPNIIDIHGGEEGHEEPHNVSNNDI